MRYNIFGKSTTHVIRSVCYCFRICEVTGGDQLVSPACSFFPCQVQFVVAQRPHALTDDNAVFVTNSCISGFSDEDAACRCAEFAVKECCLFGLFLQDCHANDNALIGERMTAAGAKHVINDFLRNVRHFFDRLFCRFLLLRLHILLDFDNPECKNVHQSRMQARTRCVVDR